MMTQTSVFRLLVSLVCAAAANVVEAQQATPPAGDTLGVGAIAGIVRDERGQPIADVRVGIETLAVQTRTDSAGRFVLAGLPARNVDVVFRFLGYRPAIAAVGVPAGQTLNLGITMVPLAERLDAVVVQAAILNQVAGVIITDAGLPIPDVTVDVLGLNRRITTNAEGRFLLTDLNPGSYILQFRKGGYRVSQYALRMIAQIERDITIKLRPLEASDAFSPELAVQVALETNQRIGFRGAQSMVIGREEFERWDTAPLGVALNGSVAGAIIREVPAACILVNGYEPLSTVIAGSGFSGLGSRRNTPTSIDPSGTTRTASVDRGGGGTGGWLNFFRANEVELVELYTPGSENSRTLCNRFPPSSGCACPPDPAGIVIWLKR
jgi:hypothetical protein